jgi:hypothetical protein
MEELLDTQYSLPGELTWEKASPCPPVHTAFLRYFKADSKFHLNSMIEIITL